MKKTLINQKCLTGIALIAVVLLCLICTAFGVVLAENNADNTIKVVHITDLHYYPTYMTYKQNYPDYYDSAMVSKSKVESKLVIESSSVLKKLFSDILGDNNISDDEESSRNINSLPDYIVVTGDLSSDGERIALIDIANALRDLQNKIRDKGKVNFQIFVIPGNHDILNENATDYSTLGGERIQNVNRYDFAKIFAGLGYPNMTDGEASLYYTPDEYDFNQNEENEFETENLKALLPYTSEKRYVHSENAKNIEFEYTPNLTSGETDLQNGDLSYVAKCNTGNTFVAIDGIVSGSIGGRVSNGVFEWLNSIKDTKLKGNLISLTHHNVLPHFTLQEQWSKDYLFENWEQVRDFLIKCNFKYNFSGHMHANDIASYCNYDGYNLYDLETGSPIGYGAQYRETKITFNKEDGTSDLYHTLKTISNVDVSVLVEKGYLTNAVEGVYNIKISKDNKIVNLAEYINERLYKNMVDNVLDGMIKAINREDVVDSILNYAEKNVANSDFIAKLFKENKDILRKVLANLYDAIQNETLKDFVYTGDKEFLQTIDNKLRAYIYNFASSLIDIEAAKGYTIQNMFVDSYTAHLKGCEGEYLLPNSNLSNAIEWLQSGDFVKVLVEKINDSNTGLVSLINKILKSDYDLTKSLRAEEIANINIILAPFGNKLDNIRLDKLIKNVAGNKLDDLPSNVINNKLAYVVSDSIAKGIGSNLSDLIRSFATDSSYDGILNIESRLLYAENDEHSHYEGGKKRPASIIDGRLPSMITMNFGQDLYTDRSLVWFTDKSVTGTDIEYCEGTIWDFQNTKIEKKFIIGNAENTKIYAVDYPLASIGIMTAYTTKEIARHQINFSGLKHDTMYTYRVGDKQNDYWSETYSFKTPIVADKTPFEVLITTDMQGMTKSVYEDSAKLIRASMNESKFGYDFMLNLGDMVDDGRNMNYWRYFIDSHNETMAVLPQVVAAGNHDVAEFNAANGYTPSSIDVVTGDYTAMQLHFDLSLHDNKNYYSFNYKGVHFVVLDTNDITENNNLSFEQIEWLTEDLEANKDNLIVVAMHKGIYSAGPHQNDKEIVNMRKVLSKLFSDYKVELVLQGHDHIYSESFFLDSEGKKTKTPVYRQGAPINNNNGGVLYVTMGSTGDRFYNFNPETDDFINKGKMFHSPTLKRPTFGRIMFDGQNIRFYSYEYDIESDRIMELKMFSNNSIFLIVSIATAVLIVVGIIALTIVLLNKHKKTIEKCKDESNFSKIEEKEQNNL